MASTTDPIESPIIILGAARSGTTLLAETILATHPTIAYWGEPAFVWRYGQAYKSSDVRLRQDATASVREYIRKQFGGYLARHDGLRFMEKTPGNCFRMPFVLEIFPRAQVVHVLRDGRDVAISAAKEWAGKNPRVRGSSRGHGALGRIWHLFRTQFDFAAAGDRVRDSRSLMEIPANVGRLMTVIRRQIFGASHLPWGPRFPGLRQIRHTYSLLQTCALQWDLSVRHGRSACSGLSNHQYLELHYEALVRRPREEVSKILDFLNVPCDPSLLERMVSGVENQTLPRWPKGLDKLQVSEIEGLVSSTLHELGYEVSQTRGNRVRE